MNRTRLVAVALLLLTARARATTTSCQNVSDNTPCIASCFSGVCMSGTCVSTHQAADGTPCSADNVCTKDDACRAGVCVAGSTLSCPNKSACEVGVCNPFFGCTFRDVCPDLSTIDQAHVDLASTDEGTKDMSAMSSDAGHHDLGPIIPGDMCTIPPGAEFFQCNGSDGFYYLPLDAGTSAPFHVRGSRIGDCSYGDGPSDPLGLTLVVSALLVAAIATRRFG